MSMDDNDGQMIFGDLGGLKFPNICLTGEEKPRKNLTQETCPDRGSNPGPLRDKRTCYHFSIAVDNSILIQGAKGAVCGPTGVLLADRSTSSKHRKCHLYLPRPTHACPRHGSWATLLAAKSCKVEGASSRRSKMGIYHLRETTLTENIILPGLLEVGIGPTTPSVKKQ